MARFRKVALALLLLPLVAFGAACDDDDDDGVIEDARTEVSEGFDDVQTEVADATDGEDDDNTPQAGGDERDGPSVEITAPDEGETPGSGDVTVEVNTTDFDVVDKLGEAPAAGEGHVHFYMDVDSVPTTPGQPAVTSEGTYHATADTSHTWEGVMPGTHTFAVQLVNNDHTPLDPPVVEEVTVTVE